MLKIIERDFRAYPPYWFYRARTAFDVGDMKECGSCFVKFNEVWRSVLRRDKQTNYQDADGLICPKTRKKN